MRPMHVLAAAALMLGAAGLPASAETLSHLDCRLDAAGQVVCPPMPGAEPAVRTAQADPQTGRNAATTPPPGAQPGSAEWNSYCAAKYKSFDPKDGMFRAMDGQRKPCK